MPSANPPVAGADTAPAPVMPQLARVQRAERTRLLDRTRAAMAAMQAAGRDARAPGRRVTR